MMYRCGSNSLGRCVGLLLRREHACLTGLCGGWEAFKESTVSNEGPHKRMGKWILTLLLLSVQTEAAFLASSLARILIKLKSGKANALKLLEFSVR